ncbi:unnamed protein product, partial [Linum tenue]
QFIKPWWELALHLALLASCSGGGAPRTASSRLTSLPPTPKSSPSSTRSSAPATSPKCSSDVTPMIHPSTQDLPAERRADAVNSLVYEANARLRDPVYGCVGAISYLQNQVSQLQMQLALAQAEIVCIGQMVGQQSPPFDSQPLDHLNGPTTPVDCLDDVVSAVDNKPLFLLQNGLLALNHHHHYDHDHHMSMKTNSFFGDIIS